MALDISKEKGVPIDRQIFTWRELAGRPYSKLDDDAFTRVRVIFMNAIEAEALRFGHACARMSRELREPLARVRRVEQHQQTLVNWLNPPDQSPLEMTIGFEQAAIEVTAALAQREPDEYLAQVYRLACSRTSTTCTGSPPCSIASRARTPTTCSRATPTSDRDVRRWSRIAIRATICACLTIDSRRTRSRRSTPWR